MNLVTTRRHAASSIVLWLASSLLYLLQAGATEPCAFNTGHNATFIFPAGASVQIDGTPLQAGDRISAHRPSGLCVGELVWQAAGGHALTVWGDDEMTDVLDGSLSGEAIHLRLHSTEQGITYTDTALDLEAGAGTYTPHGFVVVATLEASTWQSQDVGPVAAPGSSRFDGTTFRVEGSGHDIWGPDDAFHFVHRTVRGDAEVRARLTDMTWVGDYSKAGLMIREGLNPKARHATIALAPPGVRMLYRKSAGRKTRVFKQSGQTPSIWMRLVREGDWVRGYWSDDGEAWTLLGTLNLPMGPEVYVGLAVTSNQDGTLASAAFSDVTVADDLAASLALATKQPPAMDLLSPSSVTLAGSYPNPLRRQGRVRYGLPRADHVRLEVFDVLGRRLAVLVDGQRPAGWYDAPFEAHGLPSGLYLCRLRVGSEVHTKTMLITR